MAAQKEQTLGQSDARKTAPWEATPEHHLPSCFSFQTHLTSAQLWGKKWNQQN